MPYFNPVADLIKIIEKYKNSQLPTPKANPPSTGADRPPVSGRCAII